MFTMTSLKRSCTFVSRLAPAAALLFLGGLSPQGGASVEERELLLRLSQQMSEAQKLFEDPQRQSQSTDFFSQIVRAIEDQRRSRGELSEEMRSLERQALEFRARAYFNAGQLQGAEDDFRQLILANPRHSLNRELLSPKIIDFFEDQKKKLVGFLAVNSEPPGARVTVDGEFYGITNFFPVEVLSGVHRVEVTLPGYRSFLDENVRVLPQDTLTLDLALVRNTAALPIISQPAGVEVLVDGELVGKTGGTLPPDLRSFIPPGYDLEQLSDRFQLSALPLGQHVIELRRECYQPVRIEFVAEEPRDYSAQIVKLEESVGQLRLTSNPPGARVFLNGEYKGNTPLDLNRVCSGTHHLEVKHPTGKYLEDLVIEKNEAVSLECPIRPSLAFLGVVPQEGVSQRDAEDIRRRLTTELAKLGAMNLILPTGEQVAAALGKAAPGLIAFVAKEVAPQSPAPSGEEVSLFSEKLGRALEAEALLVAYVPAQRLTKDVILNLLAVGASIPDTHSLNYLDRAGLPGFVARLSEPTRLFGSWIGLAAVDTRLTSGATVLKVDQEGPAARAGMAMGDVVVEADGARVQATRELLEKVAARPPGESMELKVEGAGGARTVRLQVAQTPLEVPLNQPGFLYNKAIVDMRHRMVVEPATEPLARLNLALCHMQLGEYETALKEHLPKITLPGSRGISQGTVYYYTGVCYQRLDEREEAARMFREALKYAEATLHSNDGPRVAPLAERRLREIGQ